MWEFVIARLSAQGGRSEREEGEGVDFELKSGRDAPERDCLLRARRCHLVSRRSIILERLMKRETLVIILLSLSLSLSR